MDRVTTTVLLLLAAGLTLPRLTVATISIEDNGYRGVEVVIHKDVPEDPLLLTTLKEMLKKSSKRIYDYTNKRAYLKEVTIVLPGTWSSKPEYKRVPDDDYLSTASVRVAPPHPDHKNAPYTFQPGECGEFGKYIHFTPEFLLHYEDRPQLKGGRVNKRDAIECKNCDGLSKIFTHEWFHLRYGVFNEYAVPDHPQFKMFYMDANEQMRPNACPEKVRGWIRRRAAGSPPCILDKNGKLIGDCTFYPEWKTVDGKPPSSNASIMFMPQLISANGPCEEDDTNGRKHNALAPNEHNLKCGGRSVRKVMEGSPDFRNGRNPPKDVEPTDPEIDVFQLVNDTYPGYVLVLDVSSSMSGKPWQQLTVAASRAIKYKAKSQCPVGMVSFSDKSRILAELTPINPESREQLLKKIPGGVGGYTAIGQGLQAGMKVLENGNNMMEKGKLILITDGEENRPPNIVDVIPQLQHAKVIVYGLAFGNKASKKIEDLCRATGGKGWSFDASNLTQSLDSMLDEIFQNCGPSEWQPVINTNMAVKLLSKDNATGYFNVDQYTTETVIISLSYDYPKRTTTSGQVPMVSITSPSGRTYDSQSPEYNEDVILKAIAFTIINVESGKWSYQVKNQDSSDVVVNVMITSEPKNAAGELIRVNTWISDVNLTYPQVTKMYAEVTKGLLPILMADVFANVFKTQGGTVRVPLRDNGKGADATAHDGIYTEYYTHYDGDGRYGIDILVNNDGQAVIPSTITFNPSGAPDFAYLPSEVTTEDAKSTFPMSDLKTVDEEFSKSALFNGTETLIRPNRTFDKVGNFERFSTAGTVVMSGWKPEDKIPPARIKDLRVTAFDMEDRTVELTWTSVGDDMNDGNAATVELRFHNDLNYLMESFPEASDNFTILNGSLQPLEPYQVHVVRLQFAKLADPSLLNNTLEMVGFVVRTVDEANNAADLSNVVYVQFYTTPTYKLPFSFNTYVIVGIAIGVGICVVAVIIILTCFAVKVKQRQSKLIADSKNVSYSSVNDG